MAKLFRYISVPVAAAIAALFMVLPQTGGDVTVKIVQTGSAFRFESSTIHLKPGQRVEFVNDTRATHTATCTGCSWDTGDIQPGQVVFKSFPTSGTYAFSCRYHTQAGEAGTLIVRE